MFSHYLPFKDIVTQYTATAFTVEPVTPVCMELGNILAC